MYTEVKKIKFLKKKILNLKIQNKIKIAFLKKLFINSKFDYVINCLGIIKQKNNIDKKSFFCKFRVTSKNS